MIIEHISVSRKGTYQDCPFKYKFQYHDKIPSPEEEPFYFVYGKIVHKIAEIYVQNKGKLPIKNCLNSVISGEVELEPNKKSPPLASWPTEYKNKIQNHLISLVELCNKLGFDGEDHLEYEFKHDLDGNKRYVKGFIDRLIIKNNTFTIIDYKTTKKGPWRETSGTINKNIQLRTYARMAQIYFGAKAENIKCALYYLEDGQIMGAKFSEESLIMAERQLLEIYKQIENTKPENAIAKPGNQCKRCVYKFLCPYSTTSVS